MQNLFLTTILPMLLTAGIVIYHYEIIKPKQKETNYSLYQAWIDFIKVNINTCQTTEQCQDCVQLINSFTRMFRGAIVQELFNRELTDLWNRADTKYKLLKAEESKSKLAINN